LTIRAELAEICQDRKEGGELPCPLCQFRTFFVQIRTWTGEAFNWTSRFRFWS